MRDSFWNEAATVENFAARAPDHRLAALLAAEPGPTRLRVLDLGCAGGRNTVLLSAAGCDVRALDLAPAMVEETRRRVAPILGAEEARERVRVGRMDDLSRFADAAFDLVVALGIYQLATSRAEWQRAVRETARVLRRDGRLLVAHFAPGTDLTGRHGRPIPAEPDAYQIGTEQRAILYDADRLDAELDAHGFTPIEPTDTVRVPLEAGGRRVTVNGLYRRR